MINGLINYNKGNPIIRLRAPKSDPNSCNVLRLLAKTFSTQAQLPIKPLFSRHDLTIEVPTEKKPDTIYA